MDAPHRSAFSDVPVSDGAYRFAETLLHNGITAGCGGGDYCSTSNVTRWQMAVFLVTAFHIPFLHSWPERFTDAH
jgi:hypothetical protein